MEKKRKKPASTTSFEVKPNPTAAESLITQPQQLPSYMSNTGGQAATHTQRKTADISFMQINMPVELLGARRNSLGCKSQTTRAQDQSNYVTPTKTASGFHGHQRHPALPQLSWGDTEAFSGQKHRNSTLRRWRTTASFCNYLHRYVHVSTHYFIFMFERGNKSSIKLMKS